MSSFVYRIQKTDNRFRVLEIPKNRRGVGKLDRTVKSFSSEEEALAWVKKWKYELKKKKS